MNWIVVTANFLLTPFVDAYFVRVNLLLPSSAQAQAKLNWAEAKFYSSILRPPHPRNISFQAGR